MKVGFVVLGYGNFPMFAECVDWLMKIDDFGQCEIVLVDNCSPDGTGDKLKAKTAGIKNITVLKNSENQGFAKGNNLGYQYARNVLHCETVVVMNSDVFIKDPSFYNILVHLVEQNKDVSIIAPDILGAGDRHTNPYRVTPVSIKEARKRIFIKILLTLLIRMGVNYKSKKNALKINAGDKQIRVDGVVPHGACVIFCNKWVDNEEKAFYPGTFLYHEEFFLDEYLRKKKYLSSYFPELIVKHIGDASLDNAIRQESRKKLFVLQSQIQSLKLYLKFVKNPVKYWSESC